MDMKRHMLIMGTLFFHTNNFFTQKKYWPTHLRCNTLPSGQFHHYIVFKIVNWIFWKYEVDVLKTIMIIACYNLSNFTLHMTISYISWKNNDLNFIKSNYLWKKIHFLHVETNLTLQYLRKFPKGVLVNVGLWWCTCCVVLCFHTNIKYLILI